MTTPILRLPEVSPNQNQKEATINTSLAILEAAANDSLIVSLAAGNAAVTWDQWTRYMMFRAQGHSVLRTLTVKDNPRFFVVSNEGSAPLYVSPTGSASNHVEVPAGKIVLMITDGDMGIRAVSSGVTNLVDLGDVITTPVVDGMVLGYVGSEGQWRPITVADLIDAVEAFTDLTDTPANYTGSALKQVRVNAAGTGLEFFTYAPPFIPHLLGQLADVETATGMAEGDVLIYRDGIWQPEPLSSLGGAVEFIDLSDTPVTYTGQANKMVRVNGAANGLEFWTLPMIPTQLGQLADVESATGVSDGDVLCYRNGIWQAEPNGGSGASSFLQLSDTPANYTGAGGRQVQVNAGGTGLEFVPKPFIPWQLGQLSDVEAATGALAGDYLRYRDGVWQAEQATTVSNAFVSDHTATGTEANGVIPLNSASPITGSIPPDATYTYGIGTTLTWVQMGVGTMTIAGGVGVTLLYPADMTLSARGQYSVISALKMAPNSWLIFGDLEPA